MGIHSQAGGPLTTLYHFWWSSACQRIRLALGYKGIAYQDRPIAFDDDETFFALGIARSVPVLKHDDGHLETDSITILRELDQHWPSRPIFDGIVTTGSWDTILAWHRSANALLARLHAPVLPAYRGIGDSEHAMAAYKAEVFRCFGASIEELSNDRYGAFNQLMQTARLRELATRLAKNRFYLGQASAADMLLAADFFPLQLLDGVTLPIEIMYYVQRVEDACQTSLRDGLLAGL